MHTIRKPWYKLHPYLSHPRPIVQVRILPDGIKPRFNKLDLFFRPDSLFFFSLSPAPVSLPPPPP